MNKKQAREIRRGISTAQRDIDDMTKLVGLSKVEISRKRMGSNAYFDAYARTVHSERYRLAAAGASAAFINGRTIKLEMPQEWAK